jgi:hypothetical protein
MSSLILVGIFSVKDGHRVQTTYTKRSGETGYATYVHYTTAVECRQPPLLPAELRVFTRLEDLTIYPDKTVALIVAKGYIPPGDVTGDLLLDALHFAPFPGDPSSLDYDSTLPHFLWPLIFGLGTVSGPSKELADQNYSFPISLSEYVRGSLKQSSISYVMSFSSLFIC